MSDLIRGKKVINLVTKKQTPFRVRSTHIRKWQRHEEIALIDFMKQNRNFEKPTARIYYTKFIFERGIDIDWKLVRGKVRNMRTTYRRAKEHEISKAESDNCNIKVLKNEILKICWYVDDFDILFPNQMDNYIDRFADPIYDDELSKHESFSNADNSTKHFKNNFLLEESTVSSFFKSIDGDTVIKMEKRDEDTSIKQQEPVVAKEKLSFEKEQFMQHTSFKNKDHAPFRNRSNPIRKWKRNEQVAIIVYLKQNQDFEKPNARIYYTKFILESGIDIDWQLVRNKVRNMRTTYRKAKEHEIIKGESENCNIPVLRNEILKICWYVDDFDIIFPNEMDNYVYKSPDLIFDDDFSKDESFYNVDNRSENFKNNFLLDEDSTSSSFSKSMDGDILTVQRNWFSLKEQKRDGDTSLKQKELELAKEKLNFEKEKFRQEIRLKEREIESEERLKVMEFQMKERIAIKELEIEEMLASRSIEKCEDSYNSVYHNLTKL